MDITVGSLTNELLQNHIKNPPQVHKLTCSTLLDDEGTKNDEAVFHITAEKKKSVWYETPQRP